MKIILPKRDLKLAKKIVLQKSRFAFGVITLRALEASKALRVIFWLCAILIKILSVDAEL